MPFIFSVPRREIYRSTGTNEIIEAVGTFSFAQKRRW
jgi:hypothetical protein